MIRRVLLLCMLFLPMLPLSAQVNNAAIIYADQYTSLTYQQIVNTVCPTQGCTIYASSPNASRNIGIFDPGTKVVTLYLGPFTYNVDHIVLRKGLRIVGMGASDAGTILQSVNTNNFPLFVLPQVNDTPATDVYLYGFRLLAASGNASQSGIWLDCSTLTNAGLWHSSFEDLYFQDFKGSAIGLFGRPNDAAAVNQFISLRNIWANRPSGGGPDLRIEGANGQIDCVDCHFDGFDQTTDGWANVFIGNLFPGGTEVPYSIHFLNLTSQVANAGVEIQGGDHITFIGSHHERLNGAYLLTAGANLIVRGIYITNPLFAGNVGKDLKVPGNGYIVYATGATDVVLQSPVIEGSGPPGAPDRIVAGTSPVSVLNPYYAGGSLASQIVGDLIVTGTLSKSAGAFRIDDPLDPDNKYLSHSFVESPDMKNVYDGVAVLNDKGEAKVVLPKWFQPLNQDFRYQLSCIGGSAPVYISQEIRNNRFRIAGGYAGLKVSWQVTGIRHDAFANKHRIQVEEPKPEGKQSIQPSSVLAPSRSTVKDSHNGSEK